MGPPGQLKRLRAESPPRDRGPEALAQVPQPPAIVRQLLGAAMAPPSRPLGDRDLASMIAATERPEKMVKDVAAVGRGQHSPRRTMPA